MPEFMCAIEADPKKHAGRCKQQCPSCATWAWAGHTIVEDLTTPLRLSDLGPLPTADPHVAGRLYVDGDTLRRSTGA